MFLRKPFPLPWRVFLGYPACFLRVSRMYLVVSNRISQRILGIRYSLYTLYRPVSSHFAADAPLYPAVSSCIRTFLDLTDCI